MGNFRYMFKTLKNTELDNIKQKIDLIKEKTSKSKISIFLDMKKCVKLYGATYKDYIDFEMYNLTDEQRETYITYGKNMELVNKYSDNYYFKYFENKDEFNTNFDKYLNRKWIKLANESKESVLEFIEENNRVIKKNINKVIGSKIKKIDISKFENIELAYEKIVENSANVILEEEVKQHNEMDNLYSDSINIVNVVTILSTIDGRTILSIPKEQRNKMKLKTHIVSTYLKIGNSEMYAPINEETGMITNAAIDKQNNIYEKHPITNYMIKGFKVPFWNETLQLCIEASKVIPEMGYISWELAITKDGPSLIAARTIPTYVNIQKPIHTPEKEGLMPKYRKTS